MPYRLWRARVNTREAQVQEHARGKQLANEVGAGVPLSSIVATGLAPPWTVREHVSYEVRDPITKGNRR